MAKITVMVEVDESKLTDSQRKQAFISDQDLEVDHPATLGCEELVDAIEQIAMTRFQYLGQRGSKPLQ